MYNPKLHFHFVGIGGSGMSGLAEVLLSHGFTVSGSDLKDSPTVKRLRELGAQISLGHKAEHIGVANLVVYSSAVTLENPELKAAMERGLPLVRRAEVLAELMRLKYGVGVAGSHGKTTTTSLVGTVLQKGGLDPTVVVGGQLRDSNSGARVGKSEFLVAETDESDRSFLLLKPTVAVVTNIDSEHMSAYSSFQDLESSFEQFMNSVPFYGLGIFCVDCPKVRDLFNRYTRRKISYGFSVDAQIRAAEVTQSRGHSTCMVSIENEIRKLELPLPGVHFVQNALAAIAVGREFGLPLDVIFDALKQFSGVRRRIEVVGKADGVTVISDYGHHPTEVRATLQAVRKGWIESGNTLRVIFQPHRYSRTRDSFADFLTAFENADEVLVTEIYSAGEDPIEGIDGKRFCDALQVEKKEFVSSLDEAIKRAPKGLKKGDVLLCLGAGSIGSLPEKILEALSPKALVA